METLRMQFVTFSPFYLHLSLKNKMCGSLAEFISLGHDIVTQQLNLKIIIVNFV